MHGNTTSENAARAERIARAYRETRIDCDFTSNARPDELLYYVVSAAEAARKLLANTSRGDCSNPVAAAKVESAFNILSSALGDDLRSMRISDALCTFNELLPSEKQDTA